MPVRQGSLDALGLTTSILGSMFKEIYKNRRVLVTGHTGFKGSWLCEWLLHLGAEVAGYSKYIPSDPSHFVSLGLEKKIQHHTGDVRDSVSLKAVFDEFKPEIVFHLAAQPIVSASFEDPRLTFETNLMGTVNILEAIREAPSVSVAVIITSDKCYENVEWEYGYREQDRLGGKDPYSASKACAEIAFSAYFRSFFEKMDGVRLVTARAGNVIGGGDWAKDRIVPDCVRSWVEHREVVLRHPSATRPWQHVLEPLSGYLWLGALLAATGKGINGEAFNFGPGPEVIWSVQSLVERMSGRWPKAKVKVEPDMAFAHKEASLLKLSCDKAIHRTGWQASLAFDETVSMTMDWYLEFYHDRNAHMEAFTRRQIDQYCAFAADRGRSWVK